MKRFILLISLFFSLCASAQIDKVIPTRPSSFYAVVDRTGTLTREQVDALNYKLTQYKDSTTNEIAVVIIPTTGDYSVEEVALKILRDWGIGSRKNNNGVLILIAKNDRKIRIEVGYGLEGAIPDVTAKSIIDNDLTPNFREENYYRGIFRATDQIMKAAAGEYKAPAGGQNKKGRGIGGGIAFIVLIIVLSIIGSGRKGGGGGMMSRRGWGGFGAGWIIGSMMSGGSRSGGGWSGGGGGFGGFGGGGGGGGGASGGW